MHRRQLPIVQPCHESWDAMLGEGAERHCDSCDESVHDLSAMTEDQAVSLMAERGPERPCVRYRFDAAGRLLFVAALGLAVGGCMGKPKGEPCEPEPQEPVATPAPVAPGPDPSGEPPAPELGDEAGPQVEPAVGADEGGLDPSGPAG